MSRDRTNEATFQVRSCGSAATASHEPSRRSADQEWSRLTSLLPQHHPAGTNAVPPTEAAGRSSGIAQSQTFASHYAKRAAELGVAFFDASTVAKADPADGVHLDAQNTRAIGDGLVPVVKSLLGL